MRRPDSCCPLLWLFILAATFATPARGEAPEAAQTRGNTPPGLDEAIFVRHEDPGLPIHVTLSLDLRDRVGAEALTAAQHDPLSPLYNKWISPEEFQTRFGPLPEDLQAARDFLLSKGFTNVEMHRRAPAPGNRGPHQRSRSRCASGWRAAGRA